MIRATTEKMKSIAMAALAFCAMAPRSIHASSDHGHATAHAVASPAHSDKADKKHDRKPASQEPVCGLIEKWDGPVQILDSTRTKLIDLKLGAPLPCGAWISTGLGKVSLKHSLGFQVRVAARSFVEFKMAPTAEDALTLYQGALLLAPYPGTESLQVLTANSIARVRTGASILIYNQKEQNTQLIALDGNASLENRFESSRKVSVQAGESTTLNLALLRVIPSLPRAVALASVKPLMSEFSVTEKDEVHFIGKMQNRTGRQWAAILKSYDDSEKGRMPASTYERHSGKGPKPDVKWEDAEKKRLMNELSTIKNE